MLSASDSGASLQLRLRLIGLDVCWSFLIRLVTLLPSTTSSDLETEGQCRIWISLREISNPQEMLVMRRVLLLTVVVEAAGV